MKLLFMAIPMFALVASAADIAGTWKGTAETPNGTIERTFVFKVDGNKLTGETTSQMMGKSDITDGKIEGNDLSFTIKAAFQGNEMILNYKGRLSGDTIKFTVHVADGDQTVEYVAKKIS